MFSISQDLFRWLWPTLSLRTTCLRRSHGSKVLTAQVKWRGMFRITKGQKGFVGLLQRKKTIRIRFKIINMFGYQIWSEHGRRERVLMGGKNLFMLTQVSGLRSGLGFKGSEKWACFQKQDWSCCPRN